MLAELRIEAKAGFKKIIISILFQHVAYELFIPAVVFQKFSLPPIVVNTPFRALAWPQAFWKMSHLNSLSLACLYRGLLLFTNLSLQSENSSEDILKGCQPLESSIETKGYLGLLHWETEQALLTKRHCKAHAGMQRPLQLLFMLEVVGVFPPSQKG